MWAQLKGEYLESNLKNEAQYLRNGKAIFGVKIVFKVFGYFFSLYAGCMIFHLAYTGET